LSARKRKERDSKKKMRRRRYLFAVFVPEPGGIFDHQFSRSGRKIFKIKMRVKATTVTSSQPVTERLGGLRTGEGSTMKRTCLLIKGGGGGLSNENSPSSKRKKVS